MVSQKISKWWGSVISTLWKNQNFTLTEKIFRQINYLVISLVNALVSRNFCQKCVRENFRNFHTVEIAEIFSHFFHKNFVKAIVLLNKLLNNDLTNFFSVCIMKIYCLTFVAKIPSNHLAVFTKELFSKLIWRKKICMLQNLYFSSLRCSHFVKFDTFW